LARTELADFGDDRHVVRRKHLAAVAEAALEAVVVGRVVTGRDDHAGMRAEVTDREAQLRRRAGTDEEIGFAAELRPGARDQLGEVAGEVTDVMGDHEAGDGLRGGHMLPEADDGAEDVDIVEAGGADGRADRQPLGVDLIGGRDPADGPPAHAPRAEGDTFIETVLEFGPGPTVTEVVERGQGLGRQGP
jgi:hypothetical protein